MEFYVCVTDMNPDNSQIVPEAQYRTNDKVVLYLDEEDIKHLMNKYLSIFSLEEKWRMEEDYNNIKALENDILKILDGTHYEN